MKKLLALLLLVSPLFTWAQDDLYFVPKKEKKVLVKKTVEEVYYVNDEDVVEEFVDTLDDATNEGYYVTDLYEIANDYRYSDRIIRFHSPRKLLVSSSYLDLRYN